MVLIQGTFMRVFAPTSRAFEGERVPVCLLACGKKDVAHSRLQFISITFTRNPVRCQLSRRHNKEPSYFPKRREQV